MPGLTMTARQLPATAHVAAGADSAEKSREFVCELYYEQSQIPGAAQ
jgi:hypothetical protein